MNIKTTESMVEKAIQRNTAVKKVCAHCGSENVMVDAWAVWDFENQLWDLGTMFDDAHCDECGGETTIMDIESMVERALERTDAKLPLTNFDTDQSMAVVWQMLHAAREDLIPEGDESYDEQWDEICTAMAWIDDALRAGPDAPEDKPTFDIYTSKIDGLPVIHIDTPDEWDENENGPMFRVFINDDTDNPIWDNK
jgi:hypothetical protein